MSGLAMFAFGFAAGAISFSALALLTALPRGADLTPFIGELHPDDADIPRFLPAGRISDPPTGAADKPACFIQSEGALGGCLPVAPVVKSRRSQLHLVIEN